MAIDISMFVSRFLGTREMADFFWGTMERAGLVPDKIDLTEPIRQPYDPELARTMWMEHDPSPTHIAGGMLAKSKAQKWTFSNWWAKGEKARVGTYSLWADDKAFHRRKDLFMGLFRESFVQFGGLFGYLSDERAVDRQHVAGTLETRLPGIFWCTALGPLYVDFFGGRERIAQGPWHRWEELPGGGMLLYLTEEPLDRAILESTALEDAAKAFLGIDSFGDPSTAPRFVTSPGAVPLQIKRVPALELPEIRVPPGN